MPATTLVPCRRCTERISPEAQTCPHCGQPMPTTEAARSWLSTAVVTLAVVLLASYACGAWLLG